VVITVKEKGEVVYSHHVDHPVGLPAWGAMALRHQYGAPPALYHPATPSRWAPRIALWVLLPWAASKAAISASESLIMALPVVFRASGGGQALHSDSPGEANRGNCPFGMTKPRWRADWHGAMMRTILRMEAEMRILVFKCQAVMSTCSAQSDGSNAGQQARGAAKILLKESAPEAVDGN